jgi:hypothetical protein
MAERVSAAGGRERNKESRFVRIAERVSAAGGREGNVSPGGAKMEGYFGLHVRRAGSYLRRDAFGVGSGQGRVKGIAWLDQPYIRYIE